MEPNYGSQITYVRVNNSLRSIVEEVMPYFVIVPQTVGKLCAVNTSKLIITD